MQRTRKARRPTKVPGPYQHLLDGEPGWDMLLLPGNPTRLVDSRWRIAVHLVRSGHTPGPAEDDWTQRAYEYLKALVGCTGEGDRDRLAVQMPEIDAAYRLHVSDDKITRGTVEARLLAGQTFAETGAACGMTPEAVEAYHFLFFAVLGSLHATAYIMHFAVEAGITTEVAEADHDVLLRWAGYCFGSRVIDPMARYFRGGCPQVPKRLDGLGRDELEDLYVLLQVRRLVLERVFRWEPQPRTVQLRGLLAQLRELINDWPEEGNGPAALRRGDQYDRSQDWGSLVKAANGGHRPTRLFGTEAA